MMIYKKKKHKKFLIVGVILLFILIIIVNNQNLIKEIISSKDSNEVSLAQNAQDVKVVPLSNEEINKVAQTLLASDFIKDVPKKNPIALQFYDFKEGNRVWQSGFLMADNQLLSEGDFTIQLYLHSKYISELNNENLCEVIKKAKDSGDLGFYSKYSKASLLIKYASMIEYRDCFGV